MHYSQGLFHDAVALEAPPLGPARVVLSKPGLEHRGDQQVEQAIQYRGLAGFVLDHLVAQQRHER